MGSHTQDPFVAVDASTDLRALARALRRNWETAMSGDRPASAVRSLIDQSWSRLAAAGIDPGHLHPREAYDDIGLAAARNVSPLADVLPVLRRCLGSLAHDAEHVMVVCDEAGHILWLEGHPTIKRNAERILFTEGMLWTENSAGTNAIGTALAIGHAVQTFSAEHFLAEQHPWWCSAAPIHDPATGELVGIVDLSGPLHTAHPHSLALVMAAAEIAQDMLRFKHAEEDDRLCRLYVERTARAGRDATAVIGRSGRVLMAHPAGWLPDPVRLPPDGGPVTVPDGRAAVAEPLEAGRGWLVWGVAAPASRRVTPPALRLSFLGHQRRAQLGSAPPFELSLRHAEILALLALHADGLTAEQLTLHLYGETGNRMSTRAEVSRLRKLLGGCLAAQPYRLLGDVTADFLEAERLLAAGKLPDVVRAYRGALLPESDAPRIRQARDELDGALQRAVLAGPLAFLWAWLQSEPGREDPRALAEFVRRAPANEPRRPLAAARLRVLQARW